MYIGSIETFWSKIFYKKNRQYSQRFWTTKSSWIIFCAKMSRYSHILLKGRWKNCSLRYQYILVWRYQHSLGSKFIREKTTMFTEVFRIIPTSSNPQFSLTDCVNIHHMCDHTYYPNYLLLEQPNFVSLPIPNYLFSA